MEAREIKEQAQQNIIDMNMIQIQGTIIKIEPANKTGYYIIIQEQGNTKQQGVFSQWSYELETNGLFTLRQDNKYWFIISYQVLSERSQIKPTLTKEEPKQIISQSHNQKFYQQYQVQEIQRLKQLIQEQQSNIQTLKVNEKKLNQLLKQKEQERLQQKNYYEEQIKEKAQINKLNELELEKKISPYNSIERLYYKEHKTQEQEKYLWELNNLFNKDNQRVF